MGTKILKEVVLMKKYFALMGVCLLGILVLFSVVWASPSIETAGEPSLKSVEPAKDIVVSESFKNLAYKCNNNMLTLNGSNCNITLTGVCKGITINGSGNNIKANCKIGKVSIMGSNNNVYYSEKLNPQKPEYSPLGSGNTLTKAP
jgi:hypothetical protein